ncbi:hypothetical protein BKA67DRAFT_569402, partial [Truncatella angustata]
AGLIASLKVARHGMSPASERTFLVLRVDMRFAQVRVPFPTLDLSWLTLSSKLVFLARTQACQRQLSLT